MHKLNIKIQSIKMKEIEREMFGGKRKKTKQEIKMLKLKEKKGQQ